MAEIIFPRSILWKLPPCKNTKKVTSKKEYFVVGVFEHELDTLSRRRNTESNNFGKTSALIV